MVGIIEKYQKNNIRWSFKISVHSDMEMMQYNQNDLQRLGQVFKITSKQYYKITSTQETTSKNINLKFRNLIGTTNYETDKV